VNRFPGAEGDAVRFNEPAIVEKFLRERITLYETDEGAFYQYEDVTGLWVIRTDNEIKAQFSDDLKLASDDLRNPRILSMRTSQRLSSLVTILKGKVGRKGVFAERTKLIHCQNGMLDLSVTPPVFTTFHPTFYSRNASPVAYDPNAFGRLMSVQRTNAGGGGFTWSAVYDGYGRRLRTTNNVYGAAQTIINSTYDPDVPFLEVADTIGGWSEWLVHGPDLTGGYGDLQGTGGIDAVIGNPIQHSSGGPPPSGIIAAGTIITPATATGVISDIYGHAEATISGTGTSAQVTWNPVRSTGYGPEPGATALPPDGVNDLSTFLNWRGKYMDGTGFYYLGNRYYDPSSGTFLSCDPLGHAASMDLYSYCGGDPVNNFDPDGRCFERQAYDDTVGQFYQDEGTLEEADDTILGLGRTGLDMLRTGGAIPYMALQAARLDHAAFYWGSHPNQLGQQIQSGLINYTEQMNDPVARNRIKGTLNFNLATLAFGGGEVRTAVGIDQVGSQISAAEGTRATTWQGYESASHNMYGGPASFSARQYQSVVNGELVNGVADNLGWRGRRCPSVHGAEDWQSGSFPDPRWGPPHGSLQRPQCRGLRAGGWFEKQSRQDLSCWPIGRHEYSGL
jgi:RHS repeat-associated protein